MIQAVLLVSSVLAASFYFWQHGRDQTPKERLTQDIFIPRYNFHSILYNKCKWPILDDYESDIKRYVNKRKRLTPEFCQNNLIKSDFNVEDSTIVVTKQYISTSSIRCLVTDLKPDRLSSTLQIPLNVKAHIPFRLFAIECYTNYTLIYKESFINYNFIKQDSFTDMNTNIMPTISILYFDAMSLAQFRRDFKNTFSFMKQNQFYIYTMFNKMFDTEEEAIERTFIDNEDGNIQSVFELFKERNYLTVTNKKILTIDESIDVDISNWFASLKSDIIDNCISQNDYQTRKTLNAWMKSHSLTSTSAFISYLVEGNNEMDDELLTSLEKMKAEKNFDNTIFIILSADGIKNGKMKNTYSGRVEERNPLMMIRLPETFKKLFPDQTFNMEQNQNRLITHIDIYSMLTSLAQTSLEQTITSANLEDNSVSLWQSMVPKNRTCDDASIPTKYCLCMTTDIEHEENYNRTTDTINRVYEVMRNDIAAKIDCIDETIVDMKTNYVKVYQLNDMVLDEIENYVEFLELQVTTYSMKAKSGMNSVDAIGYFKNYLKKSSTYKLAYPYIIPEASSVCLAGYLSRFCEMCYSTLLSSPPNYY